MKTPAPKAIHVGTSVLPLEIRDGSILPLARLAPGDSAFRGARVDFHVFLSGNGTASTNYRFDDGESFAYRTGARSEVEVIAKRSNAELTVQINAIANGFGSADFTLTAPAEIRRVTLNGQPARRTTAQGVPFGPGKTVTWRIS